MSEKPGTILPGTVEKIIKSQFPNEPEKAQITVEGGIICIEKYASTTPSAASTEFLLGEA